MGTRLSRLQKTMLLACYPVRGLVERSRFARLQERAATKAKDPTDVITKALERLIARGLLIGKGTRTQTRWYITHVRLTPAGKRMTARLAGQQQVLPFMQVRSKK